MPVNCPDCGHRGRPLTASTAQRPYVARQLCSVCGWPLRLLTLPQWAGLGYPLNIKDEYRLLDDAMEGDYAAA